MDLLLSVSFQVNGDIPPRLKKSAHEIILDFIRSRPPLNPVRGLTPPHGWQTCGNMFRPQPVATEHSSWRRRFTLIVKPDCEHNAT